MRTIKAAIGYCLLVFSLGFVLALIRIPFLVPRLGERWAELLELPFMVLASYWAARWLVVRLGPLSWRQRLGMGSLALAVMLCAELGVTLARGLSLAEYIAGRDPVSGTAYLLALLCFAAMPLLVGQHAARQA